MSRGRAGSGHPSRYGPDRGQNDRKGAPAPGATAGRGRVCPVAAAVRGRGRAPRCEKAGAAGAVDALRVERPAGCPGDRPGAGRGPARDSGSKRRADAPLTQAGRSGDTNNTVSAIVTSATASWVVRSSGPSRGTSRSTGRRGRAVGTGRRRPLGRGPSERLGDLWRGWRLCRPPAIGRTKTPRSTDPFDKREPEGPGARAAIRQPLRHAQRRPGDSHTSTRDRPWPTWGGGIGGTTSDRPTLGPQGSSGG